MNLSIMVEGGNKIISVNIVGKWFFINGVNYSFVRKLIIIVGRVFINLMVGFIMWCIEGVIK